MSSKHPYHSPVRATSGLDGGFRFTVLKSDFDTFHWDAPWKACRPSCAGRRICLRLANYRADDGELTVRLARDDVPIAGRIVDLQGRRSSARRRPCWKSRARRGHRWMAGSRPSNTRTILVPRCTSSWRPPSRARRTRRSSRPVTTGADGHFHIAGIGRDRVATLAIRGPTIETMQVKVRTRPGATIRSPIEPNEPDKGLLTVYGATFRYVAGPTCPIEGVVRDKDTGRRWPASWFTRIGSWDPGRLDRYVHAITDAQGHYRLVGLPPGREVNLQAVSPVDFPLRYGDRKAAPGSATTDLPYLPASIKVRVPAGTGPIKLDISLKRGVWVTGRVLEADTGKPVRGEVQYFVFADNPHLEDGLACPGTTFHYHAAGRDGAFRLVAFPGSGLLTTTAIGDKYIHGAGVDTLKHKRQGSRYLQAYPNGVVPEEYHAVAEIALAPGTISMSRDLLLDAAGH